MVVKGYVLIPATLCNKRACSGSLGVSAEIKMHVRYFKTLVVIAKISGKSESGSDYS